MLGPARHTWKRVRDVGAPPGCGGHHALVWPWPAAHGGPPSHLTGSVPVVPGCSVVRSATKATVSACASGVSGQRSGWARAMLLHGPLQGRPLGRDLAPRLRLDLDH